MNENILFNDGPYSITATLGGFLNPFLKPNIPERYSEQWAITTSKGLCK